MATSLFRHHRAWIYGLTGLVVGVGGTILSFYLLRPMMPQGMMGNRTIPIPNTSVNRFDRWGIMHGQWGMRAASDQHFLAMMIPHHEDAVKMADLALQRAEHPEIKQLANAIKTTQTQEIEQMQQWYEQWYKAKPSSFSQLPMMRSRHMQVDLAALKTAKEFDREFILQMIPHHQMAVMMSARFMNNSQHSEMKTLTQNIIESQSKEIEQMQAWYEKWYGTASN